MKNNTVRYGIISTASIVPRFIKGMRLTQNGEISAISSRDLSKAEAMAREYNIPTAYDDYQEILMNDEIDAVYIPLINSLHYPTAKQALRKGKHVIMEKPFVLHTEDAEELKKIAEEKKLFISEAVKTPFLPVYAELKKRIDSGIYGKIRFMEFRQSYTSGPYITGWNTEKKYGGGVLYGNEAYFFTMAEFLGGKVISCNGNASYENSDAEKQCAVTVLLENNALAVLAVSTQVLFNNGLTIYLDRAKIVIDNYWKADHAVIYAEDGEPETLSFPSESEFQYELNHYNECILAGRSFSPVTPIDNTIRYISFCEKMYRSWEENQK